MVVGLGCTKSTWSPDLLHTLAQTRQIVIFDNRGSGHSEDPEWPDHATLEGYANSTVDLVRALDLEQPDILGWSMVSQAIHHKTASLSILSQCILFGAGMMLTN